MPNSPASKALRKAAKKGLEAGVRKALEEGALVNSKDRKPNPNSTRRTRVFSLTGFRFSNERGWTALHLACMGNHLVVVKLLCKVGNADCNAQTSELSTPLVVCAYNGRVDIARYLLEECGADAGIVDHVGDTPLRIAQQRKKQLVVDLLQASNNKRARML